MQVVAVLLQVLLHELEQLQLLCVLKIVPIDVGVLEDLATPDDLIDSLLQEF